MTRAFLLLDLVLLLAVLSLSALLLLPVIRTDRGALRERALNVFCQVRLRNLGVATGKGNAARHYFDQVAAWQGPAGYRTYALWLKGQSLRREKKWREAKETFEQLREMQGGVGVSGTRAWIAEADHKLRGGSKP